MIDSKSKKQGYGIISIASQGQKVKSKGEKRIADWLDAHSIVYKYEPKLSKFIPDFFLPEFGLIIEYYGLSEVSGRVGNSYRLKIDQKRHYYKKLQFRLLELYQKDLGYLDRIIPDFLNKELQR